MSRSFEVVYYVVCHNMQCINNASVSFLVISLCVHLDIQVLGSCLLILMLSQSSLCAQSLFVMKADSHYVDGYS